MKKQGRKTPLWQAKVALVFFGLLFFVTLFSGSELPHGKKISYLVVLGIGNAALVIGILNNGKYE